jgi:hypothetical protein
MALSVFEDKAHRPTPAELAAALGRAAPHWRALASRLVSVHGPLEEEWHHAGARFGWSMRLKQGKRIVVYCSPGKGMFTVGIVLGRKAVRAARASDLAPPILAVIEAAREYAEGRGVRLEVRTKADLAAILRLAGFKMAGQSEDRA